MRVLVLGGTGFLGRHAARSLCEAGHEVAELSRGNHPPVAGVEPIRADRREPGPLAAALAGRRFDFTIDFAAYDAVDIERLLLVPYAVLGRYVLVSTGQVYLVTRPGPTPFREEDSERPPMAEPRAGSADHAQWAYGMGKRRAEGTLLALRASHGVRAVILRLPIVLGEEDGTLRSWAYLERMLDGGPILLPDGGRQPTRFLYRGDVTRVLVRLLEREPPPHAVYNLSQPEVLTLRETLEHMADAAEVTPRFVEASWAELAEAGLEPSFSPYAGPWVSVLDPSRAGTLGFTGTGAESYLPGVVRWHLLHRPARSHPGYAQRELENRIASRLPAVR